MPAESPELPAETINRLADQETLAESVAKVVEYLETDLSAISLFAAVLDKRAGMCSSRSTRGSRTLRDH
jgi:hypothetical protein